MTLLFIHKSHYLGRKYVKLIIENILQFQEKDNIIIIYIYIYIYILS